MRKTVAVLLASTTLSLSPAAQTLPANRVLTHREQAPLKFHWVEQRFKTVLPALMRREGIDMWVIVSREYNDDPVFASMAPATTYSSRRRTILVFFDRGGDKPVEHLSIGRFDYDGLFTLEKTENDGFFASSRWIRPLCHVLVGSSRRMNQMNTSTCGSPAANASACRR